jgi:putative ABC transport system permease protein
VSATTIDRAIRDPRSDAPPPSRDARRARPLPGRASLWIRWRAMIRVAWSMMFHDKLKMAGMLFGVVFSVILTNQAAGTFIGLLSKNTMFIDNAGADIYVVPPGTQQLVGGQQLGDVALVEARTTKGVAWAEPLLWGGATIKLPSGGTEPVTVIGTKYPGNKGGAWNLVAGDPSVLSQPDTMIFEDSQREKLGGLNVGSVREVNGHKTHVGGFTWGLLPFGPPLAFADYEYARELMHIDRDRVNYVILAVQPGVDVESVKRDLQAKIPEAEVLTKAEIRARTVSDVLGRTAIGVTVGSIAGVGLVVGFVIVALTMFSSVVDNLREFGTLKAIGTTTLDLAKLLFVQSVTYAVIGTVLGVAAVRLLGSAIRSAKMALIMPLELHLATVLVMVGVCVAASSLALLRLRKLEPAMVFR